MPAHSTSRSVETISRRIAEVDAAIAESRTANADLATARAEVRGAEASVPEAQAALEAVHQSFRHILDPPNPPRRNSGSRGLASGGSDRPPPARLPPVGGHTGSEVCDVVPAKILSTYKERMLRLLQPFYLKKAKEDSFAASTANAVTGAASPTSAAHRPVRTTQSGQSGAASGPPGANAGKPGGGAETGAGVVGGAGGLDGDPPPGVEEAVWTRVCALRQERLTAEKNVAAAIAKVASAKEQVAALTELVAKHNPKALQREHQQLTATLQRMQEQASEPVATATAAGAVALVPMSMRERGESGSGAR